MAQQKQALTHKELVVRAEKWLRNTWNCATVLTEVPTWIAGFESPDAIGWVNSHCILVECKASVADFKADAKKRARTEPYVALGHLRFFLTEKGLLDGQQIPDRWGLYEVCGRSIKFNRGARGVDTQAFRDTGGRPFTQSHYALNQQIYILQWAVRNKIGSLGPISCAKPAFEIGEPVLRRFEVEAGVIDSSDKLPVVSAILHTGSALSYEVGDHRDADSFYPEEELLHLSDVEADADGTYRIRKEKDGQ